MPAEGGDLPPRVRSAKRPRPEQEEPEEQEELQELVKPTAAAMVEAVRTRSKTAPLCQDPEVRAARAANADALALKAAYAAATIRRDASVNDILAPLAPADYHDGSRRAWEIVRQAARMNAPPPVAPQAPAAADFRSHFMTTLSAADGNDAAVDAT